ncbi:MAG: DMT family transporter [Burkholderiaceae bacterium]|nr:DMT family transporter [Burkholderiaceae bacterium]
MKPSDIIDMAVLAALWGASFMLMRFAAPAFGPVPLAALRVIGASLFLVPLLLVRGQAGELRKHWRPLLVVGLTNSTLPFMCLSYAALSITAGMSSIFNAATPLFGAVIAWVWLRDGLNAQRVAGLAIGFSGVLWMAWDQASFKPGGTGWAVVVCLAAPLLYGLSASYTKRFLTGVPSLTVAAGSLLAAALLLCVPAVVWWPTAAPSIADWGAAVFLALACTALAYVLFFRLIANVGPARTITVTFLIPAFAVLFGRVFLGEALTPRMIGGCAVILIGTGFATGLLRWPSRS